MQYEDNIDIGTGLALLWWIIWILIIIFITS